jgi:hypothetical protein
VDGSGVGSNDDLILLERWEVLLQQKRYGWGHNRGNWGYYYRKGTGGATIGETGGITTEKVRVGPQ